MSVYFAQVGPYIKIGYSENPEKRVRNLFKSGTRYTAPEGTPLHPSQRRLIRAIDGTWDTEQLIHVALEDFCLGLEWYVDEPEVRDFIATVETAKHYDRLNRPDGPVYEPYDESRLPPEERAQLMAALNNMFKPTSLGSPT